MRSNGWKIGRGFLRRNTWLHNRAAVTKPQPSNHRSLTSADGRANNRGRKAPKDHAVQAMKKTEQSSAITKFETPWLKARAHSSILQQLPWWLILAAIVVVGGLV
jgi:hypothetical protein